MQSPAVLPLTLSELVAELSQAVVYGDASTCVTHITEDSRKVVAGSLFVARTGEKLDGTQFASQALKKGATAILCETGSSVTVEPRIEVPDIRGAWGLVAHALYKKPSLSLSVVGITGTNGKTTVASLVTEALMALGTRTARGGTLGFFIDTERHADSLTTPMPDQLAACLALARDRGASVAALEVSSHALDQKRVSGICFDVVAFTNLSQDHLDYHATMEEYAAAKAKLFVGDDSLKRVLNVDDEQGRKLADSYPTALTVSALGAERAALRATNAQFSEAGVACDIALGDRRTQLTSPLLGRHNLENLLVCLGILLSLGASLEDSVAALKAARGVRGRLERCESAEDDITVVVDYAHTPDALARVLATLSELNFSELVCVFGCGGDRDRKKRAPMGRAVAQVADVAYVTSDNPRTEDPVQILDDIRPGLSPPKGSVFEVIDRKEAIFTAIKDAKPGACVLLAGKGHEDYQLIGTEILHFDDCEEARAALLLRRGGQSVGDTHS